jgi:hypothetical protein
MKQKSSFFENINKIDKLLENMTKINKIRNEKGEAMTSTNEIQEIIREYFEYLYSSKVENLEEMYKFLDTYGQPKLNQKGINHLHRSITNNEIEVTIESPKRKSSGPPRFTTKFCQNFKEKLMPTLLNHFLEIEREEHICSIKPILYSS